MRKQKIGICLVMLCLLMSAIIPNTGKVFAVESSVSEKTAESLNEDAKVTVKIALRDHDKNVIEGIELALYQVGGIKKTDESISFEYNSVFADYQEGLITQEQLNDEDYSTKLGQWTKENNISCVLRATDETGTIIFSDLPLGVYLVVQSNEVKDNYRIRPFVVSAPHNENGRWIYEVDATPKAEIYKETHELPDKPIAPDERLPQTGQLNWPIPFLIIIGLIIFSAGWYIYFGKRKYEA